MEPPTGHVRSDRSRWRQATRRADPAPPRRADRGELVSETTGLAAKGQVFLSAVDAGERGSGCSRAWPDEAGKFELKGLEPGLYNLAASTERQECAVQEGTRVAAGAAPTEVLLEARPGATLRRATRATRPAPVSPSGSAWRSSPVGRSTGAPCPVTTVPAATIRVECSWEGARGPRGPRDDARRGRGAGARVRQRGVARVRAGQAAGTRGNAEESGQCPSRPRASASPVRACA